VFLHAIYKNTSMNSAIVLTVGLGSLNSHIGY